MNTEAEIEQCVYKLRNGEDSWEAPDPRVGKAVGSMALPAP